MHLVFTVFVYILVNVLLIKGISGLLHITVKYKDYLLPSVISGAYVSLCLITEHPLLSSVPVYFISVLLTAFSAFGFRYRCWTGMFSFALLYLALGGAGIEQKGLLSLSIGAVGILAVVFVGSLRLGREYVKVKLRYNCREYSFLALLDTGNFLKDPITGRPVLIIGADIAQEMTGLTVKQLSSPVDSVSLLPGARLIPYKTAGASGVFFLGLYVQNLKVGAWQGSGVIALSPENLGSKGTYQALTGGYV